MKASKTCLLLLTVAFMVLLWSSMASASTVTFSGYSPYNSCGSPVSSEGLTFTDTSGTGGCSSPYEYVWCCDSPNGNGLPGLIYGYGSGFGIDITKTGGGDFVLNNLQMTLSWYTSASSETIPVIADLAGGGQISTFITLSQGLQTYTFNFGSVKDVLFGGVSDGYWFMTNVNYNNSSSVPEPASLLLLGSGLLGLGKLARKRLHRS